MYNFLKIDIPKDAGKIVSFESEIIYISIYLKDKCKIFFHEKTGVLYNLLLMSLIWSVLLGLVIFILFWLVFLIRHRRKRAKTRSDSPISTEMKSDVASKE